MTTPDWSVLFIAGASGTGKTKVAKAISRELGVAWVQVDDLRLALQYSDARLPDDEATDNLHFFLRTPDVWTLPAETLADALVATGKAMTEAIAIVTGNNTGCCWTGQTDKPSLVDFTNLSIESCETQRSTRDIDERDGEPYVAQS